MLVKDLLERQKENKKTAVIFGRESISYREIHNKVKTSAQKLISQSTGCHNIGLFIHNSINYIVAYFSISYADRVIVPINPRIKINELKSTMDYCEIRVIVTDSVNIDQLKKCLKDCIYEIRIFNIDTMTFVFMGGNSVLPISESDELEDVALMLHTSGSMSVPKQVMLTHENLISCIESIIKSLTITQDDRTLITLPMFLASANTSQLLTHIYLGASIIIMEAMFTAGYFFKLVERHKVTNFTSVPYMMFSLIDDRNSNGFDISSLRFICFGGAPTPVDKIKELITAFPQISFIHMYGQTEASTRISHLLPQYSLSKIGSVGKPIPRVLLKVMDDAGSEVPSGQVGEVIIRGNNVMKGYYLRREQTLQTIRDGWLYTGDLGRSDDEGFLYIVGRKKNVIIQGGMNIYPEEIEEVLMLHPAVKEACVTGEKHDFLGEVPVASIVLKEDSKAFKENDLIDYCCNNLSSYKVPKRIDFTDELPKTPGGKILRQCEGRETNGR